MSESRHWLLHFFDALLDSFFEVRVLHGRRHPLLVVDLLVHIRLGAVAALSHQDVQLHCAGNQHSFQLCPGEQSEKLLQVQSSPDTQADQRCEVAMRHRGHKLYLCNELVARAVDRVDVDQRLQHNVQLLEVLRFLRVPDRSDVVVDVQPEIFSNGSNVLIPSWNVVSADDKDFCFSKSNRLWRSLPQLCARPQLHRQKAFAWEMRAFHDTSEMMSFQCRWNPKKLQEV